MLIDLGDRRRLVSEVELVFANFLQAEMFGTGLIESGQAGDVMDMGPLGFRAEIAQLHVFDHAFAKRCHAKAPLKVGLVVLDYQIQCFEGASRQQAGSGSQGGQHAGQVRGSAS